MSHIQKLTMLAFLALTACSSGSDDSSTPLVSTQEVWQTMEVTPETFAVHQDGGQSGDEIVMDMFLNQVLPGEICKLAFSDVPIQNISDASVVIEMTRARFSDGAGGDPFVPYNVGGRYYIFFLINSDGLSFLTGNFSETARTYPTRSQHVISAIRYIATTCQSGFSIISRLQTYESN